MNNKPILLLVDDRKDNRLAMKIALKRESYDIQEATNGQEAVDICKKINPDIILMDAMMPIMDGYDETKAIREIEEFKRTPILMVTALTEKDDKIKALDIGVNDFISKPFDKTELLIRVNSLVSLYLEFLHKEEKLVELNKELDKHKNNLEIKVEEEIQKRKNNENN